jgi:hypothetical protein
LHLVLCFSVPFFRCVTGSVGSSFLRFSSSVVNLLVCDFSSAVTFVQGDFSFLLRRFREAPVTWVSIVVPCGSRSQPSGFRHFFLFSQASIDFLSAPREVAPWRSVRRSVAVPALEFACFRPLQLSARDLTSVRAVWTCASHWVGFSAGVLAPIFSATFRSPCSRFWPIFSFVFGQHRLNLIFFVPGLGFTPRHVAFLRWTLYFGPAQDLVSCFLCLQPQCPVRFAGSVTPFPSCEICLVP